MGVRSAVCYVLILASGFGLLCSGCHPDTAGAEGVPGDYVGECALGEVYIVRGDEYQYVAIRGAEEQRLGYSYAAVLPDGRLLLGSREKGLVVQEAGMTTQLLTADETRGAIWVDPTGRYVAFLKTLEVSVSGEVSRRGIGVHDFGTGTATLVLSDPERDLAVLGWAGDRIVFLWTAGDSPLYLVDLSGQYSVVAERPENLAWFYPMRRSVLPYQTKSGDLVLLDLSTLKTQTVKSVKDIRWSKDGLEVQGEKGWETVDVGQ